MPFDSVLVANRGEVALRVLRCARSLGLFAVAVYSEIDADAPYLEAADEAVCIGPAAAAQSYLSVEAILAAAQRSRVGALHPGYGFLAESAELAAACESAGIVFVGPSSQVMMEMGRKDLARDRAAALGIPVLPGRAVDESGHLDAAGLAPPLLIKAVAGGGGKAMHVVEHIEDLDDALAGARREALSTFGDGSLLVEQLLDGARHVEVQVLGDQLGEIVHLFERDCTLQRRHQKVVEEAPPPTLSAQLRADLRRHALRLARGIGYSNAGTIEFLVRDNKVNFLEMNTRLQVEHRVTEAICGVDLVALQFQIAQGLPLPFGQDDVLASGHAIEVRVYGEDPSVDFLPRAGTTSFVHWPTNVLVDQALRAGQEVSSFYDPMLAKLVAHGPTREAARQQLLAALDDTAIVGVTTNVAFLRAVLASDAFVTSHNDTTWLERHASELITDDPQFALLAAAWVLVGPTSNTADPFSRGDGWRLLGPPGIAHIDLTDSRAYYELSVMPVSGVVATRDRSWRVRTLETDGAACSLEIDGEKEQFFVQVGKRRVVVVHHGGVFDFTRRRPLAACDLVASSDEVKAPLPGIVSALAVAVGDVVASGDVLVTLESMKMQLAVRAPTAGRVAELHVALGDHVRVGALIATVHGEES